MKTQLSKPVREKRKFAKQYKEEALKHWKSSGRSAATVAAEVGIRAALL
jgi:transposase-like protein